MVGESIANKLISLGHSVCMGSRTADNEKAVSWARAASPAASVLAFSDAARFGEIIFVCTKGDASLDVVRNLPTDAVDGKILIDVSNPLDFSHGMPPSLLICNTNSLGEEIQKAQPRARVVKTLNVVNAAVMVNPAKTGGSPTMFVSGDDAEAKAKVIGLLQSFGWTDIIDLGNIATARGTEMLLPIWLSVLQTYGHPNYGFKIIR